MSLEAKEAQREKSKLAMKRKREAEIEDEKKWQRQKNKLAMKKKREAETEKQSHLHREINKLAMKRTRQAETEEESHLHRESNKLAKKRIREAETEKQSHLHREINKLAKKRKREAETEEESHLHREINKLAMKRKQEAETEEGKKCQRQKNKLAKTRYRQAIMEHCYSEAEDHRDDMEDVISRSKKEALKFLHRTKDAKNPHKHRAIVCIICDCCIIGTEAIRKLTKAQISLHKKRLSVGSYEEYYDITLKPEVIKQYQINVDDFKGMLLSPRSRKYPDGYATCSVCFK